MARFVTAFAILLVLLAAVFFLGGGQSLTATPPAEPAAGAAQPAVATSAIADQVPPIVGKTEAPERKAIVDAVDASTGSLQVTVIWARDKTPASGMLVSMSRGRDRSFVPPEARTDVAGRVVFDGLPVRMMTPTCKYVESLRGKPVQIVAGARVEAQIEIPSGMNAKGRVVDGQQQPVADAAIVFTNWGGGETQVVGTSAADGTFALRSMPKTCHLGARKKGYRPSSMRTFTTEDGAEVAFTIVMTADGGTLAGVVLGPDGHAVAGARVRAGSMEQDNHTLPDGGAAMGPQCEIVETDAGGHFEVQSVVPGKVPVAVRAKGLAPWQDEVEVVPGRSEQITVHLLAGVTLHGTAKDDAGQPLANVEVSVGDWRDFGRGEATTAVDGGYRIEGLGPGIAPVTAQHDELGKAEASLQFVAGETQRWDPVLTAGLVLRGRVEDPEGKPVDHVMIEASLRPGKPGDRWFGYANTDEHGRFTLRNCLPERTVRITLRRSMFPELTLTDVVPGPDELVLHLPAPHWVHIKGSVLGPDDKPLANVNVSPSLRDSNSGTPVETTDPATGAFEIGPYPPGTYTVHIATEGFPKLRLERLLGPDETWDLGTLHFARGGTLVAQLVATVAGDLEPKATIYDNDGNFLERPRVANGIVRSSPLAPGDYTLQVTAVAVGAGTVPFLIRAEKETRVDVPLAAGVPVEITWDPTGTESAPSSAVFVVRNQSGAVVWRSNIWRDHGPFVASESLCPGRYAVVATAGQLIGEATFEVGDTKTSTTVRLAPR